MTFPLWVYWVGSAAITAGLLDAGVRFRRGTRRFARRFYRNKELPAVARNGPLVSALFGALLLPLVVASAPLCLDPSLVSGAPRHVAVALLLAPMGWLILTGGIFMTAAFRPPRRLMPRWLLDEDAGLGAAPAGRTGSTGSRCWPGPG